MTLQLCVVRVYVQYLTILHDYIASIDVPLQAIALFQYEVDFFFNSAPFKLRNWTSIRIHCDWCVYFCLTQMWSAMHFFFLFYYNISFIEHSTNHRIPQNVFAITFSPHYSVTVESNRMVAIASGCKCPCYL